MITKDIHPNFFIILLYTIYNIHFYTMSTLYFIMNPFKI